MQDIRNKKIVNLVDVSGFIYRAFHAFPKLTYNGQEIGALYGYSRIMLSLIRRFPNSMFIAAFDSSRRTFRNELYEAYKANRKSMPEELKDQISFIREATQCFGFIGIEHNGSEADDIIASYVKKLKYQGFIINIISSDKDLMQLMDFQNCVNIYDPVKQRPITIEHIKEKFGVSNPKQIIGILALAGDSSDNIPGVSGIGPKTASILINKFGSIENLLENLDKLPKTKKFDILKKNTEKIILSKQLAELRDNLDLDFEYRENKINNLKEFFIKFGFNSLIDKLYV